MRPYIRSRRLPWPATIVVVGSLAAALIIVVATLGEEPVVAPAEDVALALVRLDDGAAEAEARILLASLRAALVGPTLNGDGAQARHVATQLDRTLPAARLERADSSAARPVLETLTTQLQGNDPSALTTIVELERALRWSVADRPVVP